MNSVLLIQEVMIIAVLLSLPLIAYTLYREMTRHLDLMSKRLVALQRTRLLELARELLIFFGTSKASDSVNKMIIDIETNGDEAGFSLAAAEAIPDIEHLNRSLSEVLNPTISVSRIMADTKYIPILVLIDGVILASLVLLIHTANQSFVMSDLYTILEYLDLGWAIVFSLFFLVISLRISRLERNKLSQLPYPNE